MLINEVHVTKQEILNYEKTNGREAAYGLTLLYGPDCFDNYDDYKELISKFE